MAAQAKPESTALAKREPEGKRLPTAFEARLADIRARNMMVAQVASTSWGNGLTREMQRAVAEYCRVNRLDLTEVDILGGRIYRNGHYALRRLSEMTEAGLLEYAKPDHVHDDPRLVAILEDTHATEDDRAWARNERSRRMRARIEFGIPEEAAAACVFRVKAKALTEETADAKWVIKGKKKRVRDRQGGGWKEVTADPVGEESPIETVITRAAHRTMRLIATHFPAIEEEERALDERAKAVTARYEEEIEEAEVEAIDDVGHRDRRAKSVTQEQYGGGEEVRVEVGSLAIDETGGAEFQDDSDLADELPLGDTRRNTRIND